MSDENELRPGTPVTLWTPARAREEAARRARDLLESGTALAVAEVAEGFLPMGTAGLEAVLEALVAFQYDGNPVGAEVLTMAAGSLLRGHMARVSAAHDGLWDRGLGVLAGLLERAPGEEGAWQGVISMVGQVLGDHLAEQVVWLDTQGKLPAGDRALKLDQLEAVLEAALERAAAPGRAGAIVGLHQIVQFAHQQRNMTLLSDCATGDEDDLVRSVARQALIRAMDANFDIVY